MSEVNCDEQVMQHKADRLLHGPNVVSTQNEDGWGCFGTQYSYIVSDDSPKGRFPYWSMPIQFISWVFSLPVSGLYQCILSVVEYGNWRVRKSIVPLD
jgi:hypothetical protein